MEVTCAFYTLMPAFWHWTTLVVMTESISMINWLIEPLQYAFMVRGLVAAVLVGVVCAVVGTYVVLRGMAFFGDALAHAILPGVAIGYLVGGGAREPLFWWALATAVISALGIGAITRGTRIREDTAIGIIFAGMFALGIALISTVRNYSVDLTHFLFGDVLGVRSSDLIFTAIFGGLVLLIILAFYKEFLVLSFDPVLASTLRLPGRFLEYLLLILIALSIVVALQTVGVALMLAMLVTPAASAYLLTKRLPIMMVLSALFASISGVTGLYLSYYFSIASGAAIVLSCTVIFFLVWAAQSFRQRRAVRVQELTQQMATAREG
jgi:manganese/iron transport system permease protein